MLSMRRVAAELGVGAMTLYTWVPGKGELLDLMVDTVLGGDVTRVRSYSTRFAGIVFPGETLRVRMWTESDGDGGGDPKGAGGAGRVLLSVTAVERDDAPVLTDAVVAHS